MNAAAPIPAFKLVLLGDSGVGKTSIVQYFQHKTCSPSIDATVGASFLSREMATKSGPITLHIWDTAGQERYRSLISTYARDACGGLCIFDLSAAATFSTLDYWMRTFRECNNAESVVYAVGNKADLPRQVAEDEITQWATERSVSYFAVSAKAGVGIQQLFQAIADDIAERKPAPVMQFRAPLEVDQPPDPQNKCC
jgi:small GTP-binding protein